MAARLQLPYTMATLTEVQRLTDAVDLNLARMARQDMTIGGHTILKGCLIITLIRA